MRQGGEEGRGMERGVYVGVWNCQRGNSERASANKKTNDKHVFIVIEREPTSARPGPLGPIKDVNLQIKAVRRDSI